MILSKSRIYIVMLSIFFTLILTRSAHTTDTSEYLSTGIDIDQIVMDVCKECKLVSIERIPYTVYRKYETSNNNVLYIESSIKGTIHDAVAQYTERMNESSISLPDCDQSLLIGEQCIQIPLGVFIRRNNVIISLSTKNNDTDVNIFELITLLDHEIIASLESENKFAQDAGIMDDGTPTNIYRKAVSSHESIYIFEDELIGQRQLINTDTIIVEPPIGVMYSDNYEGKKRLVFLPAPDGQAKVGDIYDFTILCSTSHDLFVPIRLIINVTE